MYINIVDNYFSSINVGIMVEKYISCKFLQKGINSVRKIKEAFALLNEETTMI